ncbi:MAG: hypothetical protein GX638_05170 [Crenarchaeota archaeon]|nr:hypothetical protein [Thermoproteota archaeon]
MPQNKEPIKIAFGKEKLEKLYYAKSLFEKDTQKSVDIDEFIDVLVEAFLTYRKVRGTSESEMLKKMTQK